MPWPRGRAVPVACRLFAGLVLAAMTAVVHAQPDAGSAPAVERAPEIGTFDTPAQALGCGCSFQPANATRPDGPLLLRVNADGSAVMRLDGELVELRKTAERVIRRNRKGLSTGDKLLLTLQGAQASASVNAALERSCRVEDGCRQLNYRGVIAVSRNGARQSAPTRGVCGC